MKACLGCGSILQDSNPDNLGYTPDIANSLCQRCFKLKHYGSNNSVSKKQDNKKIVSKINKEKGLVLFIVDFLNLYQEVIDIYKSIIGPKCFIITKSDLIPKNIKKDKLEENIKNVYGINEKIIFVSSKFKDNFSLLDNISKNYKKVILCGVTNAGKSSIINTWIGSDITVSKSINTTQEFMYLNVDEKVIVDTPGFITKIYKSDVANKKIKPLTYQLQNRYFLQIADINIAALDDVNLTIYLNNTLNVSKRRIKTDFAYDIIIPEKSDLIIKGLGFIKFSKNAKISLNIASDYFEIRPTIIGGNHE